MQTDGVLTAVQVVRNLKTKLLFSLYALGLTGCSVFSFKPDNLPSTEPGFQATATTTIQPLPLPVEIAHDIATIAAGQPVAPVPTVETPKPPAPAPVSVAAVEAPPAAVESAPVSTGRRPSSRPTKRPLSGNREDYVVRPGDTLMKISFQKYGDVYRWRDIYNTNKDKIPDFNSLQEGTVLTVRGVEYVVIKKNGLPYLIRRNDTLVKISDKIYGTPEYWRAIWKNNPQLIHNPNRIYAGFTLYYEPKNKLGQHAQSSFYHKPQARASASITLPTQTEAQSPVPLPTKLPPRLGPAALKTQQMLLNAEPRAPAPQ